MADDDISPIDPISPVRAADHVAEPRGYSGLRRWMDQITRDRLRIGRGPRDGQNPSDAKEDDAKRRAWEDELTGEGKVLDLDA